ncbi:MAG: hypothetical protein ACOX7H_00890 [Bacillota bacterium]
MRITNKMITNTYMNNLNKSFARVNELNEKVTAGRKYLKASEDPATALKAYQVRQHLSRISLYKENVKEVEGLFTEVEACFSSINTILGNVNELLIQGNSGSHSEDGLKIIAENIRNYQEQLFSVANSNYSGQYIFGGHNMKTIPFTLDSDGNLYYQGINVNDDPSIFPEEELFFDIGLGLSTTATGQIVPGTALNIAHPGSEIFGTGIDSEGLSNNYYALLGQIADLFESGDISDLNKYMAKLDTCIADNMLNYTNIGQKNNFIDFLKNRFDTDEYNALIKQKNLEGIDPALGIMEFNMQELSYQSALKMGSKIIQPSLLDYLR